MTILDNSTAARRAIRRAIRIAREEGAALVLVGIDDPFDVLTPEDAGAIRNADEYLHVVVERELKDVAREARAAKVPLTYRRILRGHPLTALQGAIDAHHPRAVVVPGRFLARLAPPDEDPFCALASRVPFYLVD